MKAQTAFERMPISSLAVKGSCPVCCAVKHCQELLPGRLRTEFSLGYAISMLGCLLSLLKRKSLLHCSSTL